MEGVQGRVMERGVETIFIRGCLVREGRVGALRNNNNKRQARLIKYLEYLVNCTSDA